MATNPLVTLAETTSKISEDISPAKAAYILSQILERIGYDEESFETSVEQFSLSEQEDAIKTLSEIIGGVNSGKSYEESILTAFSLAEDGFTEVEQEAANLSLVEGLAEEFNNKVEPLALIGVSETLQRQERKDEIQNTSTFTRDVIEEVTYLTKQEETSANLQQQNTENMHRYVIPLALTRLMKEESVIESRDTEDLKTRIYESEKFTAILKFTPGGEQLLALDRNAPLENNEEARALEATRESSQLRFEVIINNLTQQELEKIKIIALQEAQNLPQNRRQQGELGE
ncbi:hypothetical protein [Nostoc sp. CHAB 5715]|uniref:hypothetical protein n=1 Tax=Nostoc sp. CHAB 5715 TaxID=2780400 RepID=UPI001E64CE73|nr:hypothetical protein [Nostoc sp. CHAB 5715]MCC5623822.1 hypothetical protein [Nostoc sp. CHAB 5715]